ncbi:type III polyketide synthase [Terriglobus aquaticus]|uniref:Type III polyketide synthase n=1 Tax=Terriglobus aquaticus TaxID=940139 RepID=A0ABW9KGZ5_9BACT|nr:type III polyketide synthase [Terriglobus aquaticus]
MPQHEVHDAFLKFAHGMLQDPRSRALLLRMAERAGIERRYSPLSVSGPSENEVDAYALYRLGSFPATAERMRLFKQFAPALMRRAVKGLALSPEERARVRHVIVTTCTGFYAPGLDFDVVDALELHPGVERTMLGFMGCYAAINGLKQARHLVRSEPDHDVVLVNLELCTLHLQETQDLNKVLSFLIFGDGCAASLITSKPGGLRMDSFRAVRLEGTADLITWNIGDQGFDMVLSGQVPAAVGDALRLHREELVENETTLWAVHPGGRSVLDAVEQALDLPAAAMEHSRAVLRDHGNMSSATVMFVLQSILRSARAGEHGCAMSFGPGLTAETMRFVAAGVR